MIYIAIALAAFVADFFIKKHIDKTRKVGEESPILGGRILIRKYYNKGAMMNFLAKWPKAIKMISGAMMILLCILFFFVLKEKGKHGLKLGMALILGGGASNLCDRLMKGQVVDYFSFKSKWKKLQRIVFNLSDMFIFLGTLLVLFSHEE